MDRSSSAVMLKAVHLGVDCAPQRKSALRSFRYLVARERASHTPL